MGRFNRDFNRRHPAGPQHQRNFQWDGPCSWRDCAQEPYWRNSLPDREQPYWRGPPPSQEERYWRRNSSQFHNEDRGGPVYRGHRQPPNPRGPAAFDRGRDHNQFQSPDCIDQHSPPATRRDSVTMGSKKGQSARTGKLSEQDDANEISQEVINVGDDSNTTPSNKLKRKRAKSNDQEAATPQRGTENDENSDQDGSDSENDTERTISAACTYLKLDRGSKLVVEASSSPSGSNSLVPTIGSQLTRRTARYKGSQSKLWDTPVKSLSPTTMVILDPVLDEARTFEVMTLAQEFIRCPEKRWLRGENPQLCAGIPYYEKYYIWARMMLLSEEDKNVLDRADVLRGIFGSLFQVPKCWPLIQAFVDSWNVNGHTVITSQGEMGYSLLLVSDAMGIPISGHAYDEYVPSPFLPNEDTVVKTLHAIYAKLCKWRLSGNSTGKGLVSVRSWLDYFLNDKRRYENISETSLPHDYYAPALDPFLKKFGFQVANLGGENPSAFFSGYRVDYETPHSKLEYRAAFVATWLCIYCVPLDGGLYIRPEVFSAAASIAKGTRKAIGIAGLANLYSCLDAIYHSVTKGDISASKCDLPLPTHYIMGWFAAYWKAISKPPLCLSTFVKYPPFIVDCGKASQIPIDLAGAHRIFLATDEQEQCLLSLDFIGRQGPIHFGKQDPVHLNDSRETPNEERSLEICEIDIIISSIVGGVSHRRCQFQNNQVYCPHRFARSHNCDQEVPDFFMDGKLQFSGYLKGTLEETTEFLTRRLLGYLRPGGHSFELMSRTRPTHCSYEYLKWRISALSFLQQADIFAATIDTPGCPKNKAPCSTIELEYSSTEQIFGATPEKQAKETAECPAVSDEKDAEMVPTKKAKRATAEENKSKGDTSTTHSASVLKQSSQGNKISKVSDNPCEKTTGKSPAKKTTGALIEKLTTPVMTPTKKKKVPVQDVVNIGAHTPVPSPKNRVAALKKANNEIAAVDIDELPLNKKNKVDDGRSQGTQSKTTPSTTSEKDPKKSLKGSWNTSKRIERLSKIKEDIQGAMQRYVEEAGTAFDSSNLPSPPRKFDQSPGIALRLPESADAKVKLAFQHIVGGLKALQTLARAEAFNQKSFLDALASNLDLWENFFSASFTEEVKVMVTKLQSLRKELDEGIDQQPQIDFCERSKQVDQMLERAVSLSEQIIESQAQVEKNKLAGEKRQELLNSLEISLTSEIKALEVQLADKKESLEYVQSQKTEILNFFKAEEVTRVDINACFAKLKEAIAQGDSMSKKMHEFQKAGNDSGNKLSGPVHALRNLIKAYRIEE